jgi:glucoamylase
MIVNLKNKIFLKILDNVNLTKNGSIVASPSMVEPNYYFHWIRDSAITIKTIISEYKINKDPKLLKILLKYIDYEFSIQNIKTLSGLGEPKFNTDGTSFNEEWGRPQNDGPALRGLNMINIAKEIKNEFPMIIKNIVNKIIINDMNYTIDCINNPCFDLWEEKFGYHFYTRVVQSKFLKECINYFILDQNDKVKNVFIKSKELLNHHFQNDHIISSFDLNGNILRKSDSSLFMCLNHINWDINIIPSEKYFLFEENISDLINSFNKKYNDNFNMIGRYQNDKYFDGHVWLICTISMLSFFKKMNKNKKLTTNIFNKIINLDDELNLSEQYNPKEKKFYSVKKLTWNYSELYFLINL